jgi:hypothetical protein
VRPEPVSADAVLIRSPDSGPADAYHSRIVSTP